MKYKNHGGMANKSSYKVAGEGSPALPKTTVKNVQPGGAIGKTKNAGKSNNSY
jgi:hypothetical protein